jgi:hypothetical protein
VTSYYVLDGRTPRRVTDPKQWSKWFGTADRTVGRDVIADEVLVSTVFLGLDHNFGGSGPPVLFETMVFHGDDYGDVRMRRYSTWEEAERGHAQIVAEEQANAVQAKDAAAVWLNHLAERLK